MSSSDSSLTSYFRSGKLSEFHKGDIIVRADQLTDSMYFIDEGFAKVYSLNARNEQYVHIIYGPGEIFPLFGLIDNLKTNTYFEAISKLKIYELPTSEVRQRILSDSNFSYEFLSHTLGQFRVYTDRIDNLEYKFASERLVYRLLFLAKRFGVREGDGAMVLQVPVTQQTLAGSINLSRESVTRELDKLFKRGLIRYNGRQIVLVDIEQLKKLVRGSLNLD